MLVWSLACRLTSSHRKCSTAELRSGSRPAGASAAISAAPLQHTGQISKARWLSSLACCWLALQPVTHIFHCDTLVPAVSVCAVLLQEQDQWEHVPADPRPAVCQPQAISAPTQLLHRPSVRSAVAGAGPGQRVGVGAHLRHAVRLLHGVVLLALLLPAQALLHRRSVLTPPHGPRGCAWLASLTLRPSSAKQQKLLSGLPIFAFTLWSFSPFFFQRKRFYTAVLSSRLLMVLVGALRPCLLLSFQEQHETLIACLTAACLSSVTVWCFSPFFFQRKSF